MKGSAQKPRTRGSSLLMVFFTIETIPGGETVVSLLRGEAGGRGDTGTDGGIYRIESTLLPAALASASVLGMGEQICSSSCTVLAQCTRPRAKRSNLGSEQSLGPLAGGAAQQIDFPEWRLMKCLASSTC